MLIVVGLGNPGTEYTGTRHNTGFMVVDDFVRSTMASNFRASKDLRAEISEVRIGGEKVLIMKPVTFMNLSGDAVLQAVNYYKVDPLDELVVVCDDIHLDMGRIRIRKKGSDGGHNGLKDIMGKLGTNNFPRVRVGVGEVPERFSQVDWVLSRFTQDETGIMEDACVKAAKAIEVMAMDGIDRAMNQFNEKPTPEKKGGAD
ncbi:MAG: aminoacyl-tRNA hydrolase [Lachnospiraceae bacterium]|nr:aminoacyl-tRNA hydrolase [Lachnospiraceae bacterium]